jgi:FkbM family methyltransferase
MQLLDALCDPNKTGIDVGAKVGMYTYRILARSADVIAFEPNPLFNQMLKAVFSGKRARVEPVALSNTRGAAILRLPYDSAGSPQFGRATIDANNKLEHEMVARVEQVEVETRTIDDYALPNVGFIKIDVEGHELAVLEGAEGTISKQRPTLLVESNDDHKPGGVTALIAWLRAHDYDVVFLAGQTLLDADQYDRAEHWGKHTIENFIGVARSRPDVMERLRQCAARVTSKRPARSKPPKPRHVDVRQLS